MRPVGRRRRIIGFLDRRTVQFAARLLMGGAFVWAGIAKIAAPKEFARIVVSYELLPESIAVYLAFVLPWIELLLGFFLIIGFLIRETALALSFLLLIFAGAVLFRYFHGGTVDCGCFSMKSSGSESLLSVIARDVALLSCGVYLFFGKLRFLPAEART